MQMSPCIEALLVINLELVSSSLQTVQSSSYDFMSQPPKHQFIQLNMTSHSIHWSEVHFILLLASILASVDLENTEWLSEIRIVKYHDKTLQTN